MKQGEIKLNKWHFKLGFIKVYYTDSYLLHFGVFKPIKYPTEGGIWDKEKYKGFWFRKYCNPKGFEISF